MSSPLTRRQLATALATVAAAAAQAPATTPAPAGDLESAREQLKKNREAIGKVKITETLEPALTFKP